MIEMVRFQCPNCSTPVLEKEKGYLCESCNTLWEKRKEIPCFTKNESYWGELSQERMRELIESAERNSWKDAIKSLRDSKPSTYDYCVDESRANWRFLLPVTEQSVILDVGSGWGTLSFPLAKDGARVVAMDSVYERVRFVNIRRKQEGITNLQAVWANVLRLPFPDSSFNLVIMNGVLEWVGLSDLSRDPLLVQKQALQEMYRVLRPGGYLYIGIENRWGIDNWIGIRDSHSGLRFITLLPRPVANIYSRMKKGQGYHTYTHSHRIYNLLLKKTGFSMVKFYLPVPNYRNFNYLIPWGNCAAFKYCFMDLIQSRIFMASALVRNLFYLAKLALFLGLVGPMRWFMSSFSIVAKKGEQ